MSTNNTIKRRSFFKMIGTGTAALSSIVYARAVTQSPLASSLLPPAPVETKMTTRLDPVTGKGVSILGYGGMRWPSKDQRILQDKVNELIDVAMKNGVNYYDTAPVYHNGQSEKAMGESLRRYPRESYFIATKLSNFNANDWSFERSKAIYDNSFKELGLDYIDFYLLHSVGPGKENFDKRFVNNGMLDFLQKERQEGRIRHLGFSYHGNRESFLHALSLDVKWDFVQIQLNYFDWLQDSDNRPSAEYLYEELTKRQIPVVVMEPLLGGRLAKLNDQLLAKLKERDPNQTPAAWAFRFAGSLPNILTVLSGMTYMEHLTENIDTFSPLKPVSDADKTFLQETATAMMKYPTVPCTACRYCMPCPFNVDIPGNFAYLNKCIENGNIPASRQSANYTKARSSFLKKYSKSVPSKKQASHCTACGQCMELCPQHIKIPEQMKRINELVDKLQNNTL